MLNKEKVQEILSSVAYPGFTKDIVTFGFVKNIEVDGDRVAVDLDITSSAPEVAQQLREEITKKLQMQGAKEVIVNIKQPVVPRETSSRGKNLAPQIKNFVMISSGKGGVGKSTTTVNLAIATAMQGKKVGILDADIYGPNIPRMMGILGVQPEVVGNKVKPIETKYGVEVMSMGVLMEEGQSLIWRGAMIMKAVEQFLRDILWSDLDVLFISRRSLDMFKKLHIPIAGIIENMSGFICPSCKTESDIFGKGTAHEVALEYGTSVLGQIPIEPAIREGGDEGKPVVYYHPESETAKRYHQAANKLWHFIEKVNEEGGASNEAIQPTTPPGVSACSIGGGSHSGGHSGGGCGCS